MEIVISQVELCGHITDSALKLMVAEDEVSRGELLKSAGIELMKLKTQNRKVYLSLDMKQKEVEVYKEKIDRLHLDLENLLYKRAYLKRQIRQCKDLSVPNLTIVEEQLEHAIAATTFTPDLDSIHASALSTLQNEALERKKMEGIVASLTQKHQKALDTLDKKRKFLDELPMKVSVIKASTLDLQNQFSVAVAANTL